MFGIRKLKADVQFLKSEKAKLFKNDDEFIVAFGRLEASINTLSKQVKDLEEKNDRLTLESQIHHKYIDDILPIVFKVKKKPGPKPKPKKKDEQAR